LRVVDFKLGIVLSEVLEPVALFDDDTKNVFTRALYQHLQSFFVSEREIGLDDKVTFLVGVHQGPMVLTH